MKKRPGWGVWLVVVLGAVTAAFVAATAFTHYRLAGIDRASVEIADNAAPSIERLAAARGEMRQLQVTLHEYIDHKSAGGPADAAAVEEARRSMDRSIAEYLSLPIFPGEQSLWADILQAQGALNAAVAHCQSAADRGDIDFAKKLSRTEVMAAVKALGKAITGAIELNAHHSRDLAMDIKRLRTGSTQTALGLDAACILLAIAGAVALHRALRAHAELTERHQRLLEERASELEQFSGRIAHDILSPLGTIGFALQLTDRTGSAEARARHIARGSSALARVQRLVSGLLEFARAGARPETSARIEIGPTMADLVSELEPSATEKGITLAVDVEPSSAVLCDPGVLTSVVSNLMRNAIKYIGDGPLKRIELRSLETARFVRIEVQDTGPGLPRGSEALVFEPYFRGAHRNQTGIGLGLATVKRLVEGHGGHVGVDSTPGEGCTFWFELPKAPPQSQPVRRLALG